MGIAESWAAADGPEADSYRWGALIARAEAVRTEARRTCATTRALRDAWESGDSVFERRDRAYLAEPEPGQNRS